MARTSSFALFFLGLCLSRPAVAVEPTSIPRATTQQVHRTVERALGYLQTESAAWLKTRHCAACHHVPMPLWGLSEAERQGYAIDKKYLADTIESLLGNRDKLMASRIFPNPAAPPDPRPQGRGLNSGLPFLAVAAQSMPDGSPGGSKLLTPITCAASSWAALGLARLVPKEKPASKADADRNAQKIPTNIAGTYKGGELVELRVRDRIAYLIKPTGKIDRHKRWVWDFPFWLAINDGFGNVAHRYYVEKLLAAGFHIAGVDVGPSCGSPAAAEVCQEFYDQLVSKHGLHRQARLLAHSHGGLIAYGWAFRHPKCVDRIAGMCPATDFRTYPTLPGVVTVPAKGLDYGLSLKDLDRRAGEFNPIDNLAPLAKAGVKILHLHGAKDTLVPTGANSTELARRYRERGGVAEVVLLQGLAAAKRGHDGPELYESARLLKFLLAD